MGNRTLGGRGDALQGKPAGDPVAPAPAAGADHADAAPADCSKAVPGAKRKRDGRDTSAAAAAEAPAGPAALGKFHGALDGNVASLEHLMSLPASSLRDGLSMRSLGGASWLGPHRSMLSHEHMQHAECDDYLLRLLGNSGMAAGGASSLDAQVPDAIGRAQQRPQEQQPAQEQRGASLQAAMLQQGPAGQLGLAAAAQAAVQQPLGGQPGQAAAAQAAGPVILQQALAAQQALAGQANQAPAPQAAGPGIMQALAAQQRLAAQQAAQTSIAGQGALPSRGHHHRPRAAALPAQQRVGTAGLELPGPASCHESASPSSR